MKSLQEMAREALEVQNACNLSGVVHSFSRTMTDLREALQGPNFSTEMLNTHPITVMFSDKIASLTGSEGPTSFIAAMAWCEANK